MLDNICDLILADHQELPEEHMAIWGFVINPMIREFERKGLDLDLEFVGEFTNDMFTFTAPDGFETGDEDSLESVLWERWPELARIIDAHDCEHEYIASRWVAVSKKGFVPEWARNASNVPF